MPTRPQHPLSIFEFQEMFASARSMALVGSASSVETLENGERIDACDIVVRFNRATTEGKERHVGLRTDIVVANEANNLSKAPPVETTVRPKCVVTFIKTPSLRGGDLPWKAGFFEWIGSTPLFLTCGPEILCCDVPKRRRGFSMGTYALAALPHLLSIERLFVTGFTMFGAVEGGAHHYCKEARYSSVAWHDAELERRVFAHLLASTPCC